LHQGRRSNPLLKTFPGIGLTFARLTAKIAMDEVASTTCTDELLERRRAKNKACVEGYVELYTKNRNATGSETFSHL
jgi:hypothetical protein